MQLRLLSIQTDTILEVRKPFHYRLKSSKCSISSVIAEGREDEPCEYDINSAPVDSISQPIKASLRHLSSNALFPPANILCGGVP